MRFRQISDAQVAAVIGRLIAQHERSPYCTIATRDIVREFGEALGYTGERERLEWSNRVVDVADRS